MGDQQDNIASRLPKRILRACLWLLLLLFVISVGVLSHLRRITQEHTVGTSPSPSTSTASVLVRAGEMDLLIPHHYFRSPAAVEDAKKRNRGARLLTRYPGFDGYSVAWASAARGLNAPEYGIVAISINVANRTEESLKEVLDSRLPEQRIKSKKPHRLERSPDRANLPGFAVYQAFFGNERKETLYETRVDQERVVADCADHVDEYFNPTCRVTIHWLKNVSFTYVFSPKLLPRLPEVHVGVRQLLTSFVATKEEAEKARQREAELEKTREKMVIVFYVTLALMAGVVLLLVTLQSKFTAGRGIASSFTALWRHEQQRVRYVFWGSVLCLVSLVALLCVLLFKI